MRWPWRRGTHEAEQRLADAEKATSGIDDLVAYSREVNARLRQEVARNGFGELLQLAMGGRQRPDVGGQQ